MYIKSVEFTNLRCFKEGKLDFRYPGDGKVLPDGVPNLENVNVILGVNGTGKTTALKAVALALLAQLPNTGFRPYSLVRRIREPQNGDLVSQDIGQAQIEAKIQLNETREQDLGKSKNQIISFESKIDRISRTEELLPGNVKQYKVFYDDETPSFFMVAYGATRRTETGDFEASYRRKLRSGRYERVAGLFEDYLTLVPLQSLLMNYPLSQLQKLNPFLKKLLPLHIQLRAIGERDVFFEQNDIQIPFVALSDGYRAYIGWIIDLLYQMISVSRGHQLEELRGVVLVDEIDLHVHPEWQKTIIAQVANAFPNLQFIFTTHSPIVAGSVSSENLWITKIAPDGSSILERPHTEIYGLSADQILMSDIFGLQSTRAEGFLKEMDLLEQKAIRGDEDAALALMRGMARGKGAVTVKEPPAWVKKAAAKRKKS